LTTDVKLKAEGRLVPDTADVSSSWWIHSGCSPGGPGNAAGWLCIFSFPSLRAPNRWRIKV